MVETIARGGATREGASALPHPTVLLEMPLRWNRFRSCNAEIRGNERAIAVTITPRTLVARGSLGDATLAFI